MAFTDHKLKFVIDADGKAARKELVDIDQIIGKVGSGLGSWAGPAAIGATAIAGATAAIAGTGVALFNLTKQASDYGSEIYNASVKTGLHAETISALKLASDRTGVSLESVGTIVGRFSKQIGEAAQGSEEAKDKLTRLGIDPKVAINDLDGALAQAIKRISEMESPIARATAAQQLFGKAGTELLKVIDDTNGDLPKLIEQAKRLGVTMSDKDAAAADEFGDQMDVLNNQISAATRTIGQAFMPVFLDMAKGVSEWLTTNKDDIAAWGTQQADTLRGLISLWNDFHKAAAGEGGYYRVNAAGEREYLNLSTILGGTAGMYLRDRGTAARMASAGSAFGDAAGTGYELDPVTNTLRARTAPKSAKGDKDYLANQEEAKKAAEKAQKEAEDLRKRQLGGQLGQIKAIQDAEQHALDRITVANKAAFEARAITADQYLKIRLENEESFAKGAIEDVSREYELKRQQEKLSSEQLKALKIEEDNELQKIVDQRYAREQEAKKEASEQTKKLNEDQLTAAREAMERSVALQESEMDKRYANVVRFADAEMRSADDVAKFKEFLEVDLTEFRIQKLKDYSQLLDKNSKEYLDVQNQIKILENQLETQRATNAVSENKRHADRIKSWNEYLQKIKAVADREEEADQAEAERNRRRYEAGTVMGGVGIGGAIGRGLGVELAPMFDAATNSMLTFQQRLALVHDDINNFVGQSIGGLIDGLVQMGVAWLTTGEFSARAALQMAAGAALGIAVQAGIKGLFEVAEAAAAAARLDPWGAAAHTAAAGLFFGVAATAGAIGVGAALGARAMGGGGGKGASGSGRGASSNYGGGQGSNRDMRPISRVTDDAYISGRRGDPATEALTRAVEKLDKRMSKFDSMRPGDVLVAGARQKRGFIANQAAEDVKSNAALGVKLGRSMNLR